MRLWLARPIISRLIAPFPVDDVLQRLTVEISPQIVAKELDRAVPILVAGARDMGRDQHPRIGPQLGQRRVLELAVIDIEHDTPQATAAQRVNEGCLIDDLAARDVDQYA